MPPLDAQLSAMTDFLRDEPIDPLGFTRRRQDAPGIFDDDDDEFFRGDLVEVDLKKGETKEQAAFKSQVQEMSGLRGYKFSEHFTGAEEQAKVSPDRWFATHANGQIPLDAMTKVSPGHYLRPDVAEALMAMKRAAKRDGVVLSWTDTYRTLESQRDVARRKGLYSQGGLAAEPGTSNHGWGTAIDFGEGRQRDWLANNGARFGFQTIDREPWHWEYRPNDKQRHKPKVDAWNKPRRGRAKGKSKQAQVEPGAARLLSDVDPYIAMPSMLFDLAAESRAATKPKKGKAGTTGGGKVPGFIPAKIRPLIQEAARATGVSPRLIAFVMWMENTGGSVAPNKVKASAFKERTSGAGAIGLMQVVPKYWDGKTPYDIYDRAQNVMAGAWILGRNLKNNGGSIRDALAVYYSGDVDEEGLWYANTVLKAMKGYG